MSLIDEHKYKFSKNEGNAMGRPLHIFIKTPQPLDMFVKKLADLLSYTFERNVIDNEIYYKFQNYNIYLYVGMSDYENEGQLLFENYQYEIEIDIFNAESSAERHKQKLELGHKIFDRLEQIQLYSLMMVDNLQVKLREFERQLIPAI